jgi:hypothetical protein
VLQILSVLIRVRDMRDQRRSLRRSGPFESSSENNETKNSQRLLLLCEARWTAHSCPPANRVSLRDPMRDECSC